MSTLLHILETFLPIAVTLLLGVYARRRAIVSADCSEGMQRFAIRFALPCVMFNACLTGDFGPETILCVALLSPLLGVVAVLCFRARRRGASYNLPAILATQESGMLGIPLFLILFGPAQVYRMAALNMAQGFISIPLIAILSAQEQEALSAKKLAWKICSSPLLLAMAAGIALNVTGAAAWLDSTGIGPVIVSVTEFIAAPVSAVILFTIGYNFTLSKRGIGPILTLCGVHLVVQLTICAIVQLALFLVPGVAAETRWAVLLFSLLPAGYIAPGLGRNQEESSLASGVCSISTVVTVAAFFAMVVILA